MPLIKNHVKSMLLPRFASSRDTSKAIPDEAPVTITVLPIRFAKHRHFRPKKWYLNKEAVVVQSAGKSIVLTIPQQKSYWATTDDHRAQNQFDIHSVVVVDYKWKWIDNDLPEYYSCILPPLSQQMIYPKIICIIVAVCGDCSSSIITTRTWHNRLWILN